MKQNIKNIYFTIICTAIIAVLVCLVLGLACLGKSQMSSIALAESEVLEIDATTTSDGNGMNTINVAGKTYYMVQTAKQLKYVLITPSNNNYLLMHDFKITDPNWVNSNSTTAINCNFYGNVLDESGKNFVEGQYHSITFASSVPVDSATGANIPHNTKLGGLFGKFSGSLNNLTYIFSGSIEVMGNVVNSNDLSCGSLAGEFSGTINNCNIITYGSIIVYAQKSNVSIYVGGIAGKFLGGTIQNSRLNIGGNFMAQNKLNQSEDDAKSIDATNVKQFVGGIAAHSEKSGESTNQQPRILNSDIIISAKMSTTDVFQSGVWGEIGSLVGGWTGLFGDKCNGADYIMPVGGLFGQSKKIEISGSTVQIDATLSSTGEYLAAQAGVITGGIIGYVPNDAIIQLNNDTIKLTGKMTTKNESKTKSASNKFHGQVFQGGIIGRFEAGVNQTSYIKDSVIERSGNFYTETESKYAPEGNFYGYLSGNTGSSNAFATLNKGNVWIKGSKEGLRFATDTSSKNESTSYGLIHNVDVRGGGFLTHTITTSGQITFFANQQFSPFYGWYETAINMNSDTKYTSANEITKTENWDTNSGSWVIQSKYTPQLGKSRAVTMYAMFLTQDIYTSGNMVQFAEEMNSGLNFSWIEVELKNDISFSQGMPVIGKFDGKFEGNNHTITFEAGSKIIGNGNVAMFAELTSNAKIQNTKIVFAGTVYAGNHSVTALDDTTVSAILVAQNKGYINNITLDLAQAGTISSFAKNNTVGTLIGINEANISGVALSQIDLTIDGKITVVGDDNSVGGLVGVNKSMGKYEMINVFAKGEIISAAATSDSATNAKANLGGMVGKLEANLNTVNTVINVRDYSNYNNDVLMATCSCNQITYELLVIELDNDIRPVFYNGKANDALSEVEYLIDEYFEGDSRLTVAKKSQNDYDDVYTRLNKLKTKLQGLGTGTITIEIQKEFEEISKIIKTFDCSAQCVSCASKTNKFAIVGSTSSGATSFGVSFDNTWVMGSYTQYIDDEQTASGVGSRKLYYYSKNDTIQSATDRGLNLLYVRDGSATCLMDISSKSANNIRFTVSVDTIKVFTGWYTTFNHSTMVDRDYIKAYTDESGSEVQVLQPGTQRGMTVYSSVISSLITSTDILNQLAITTNAGQTYKGVRFVLGSNITVSQAFQPIGTTKENCFDGSLDGKGYTITFTNGIAKNSNASANAYGLFGYLGSSANITALNVVYNGSDILINDESGIFGGLAGVNEGTIGQDSTSNKITVTIENKISGIRVAGGLVGINKGLIQNAEVKFSETGLGIRGQINVNGLGSTDVNSAGVVGGAVGINEEGIKTVLKNTIVSSEVTTPRNITNLNAFGALTYAGGLVGYNSSAVYSCVVKVAYESDGGTIVSSETNQGIIIGYNEVSKLDALWALYAFDPTYGDYAYSEPAMDDDGTFAYELINGECSDWGNRLVKYGYGELNVYVYANNETQNLGGSIVFEAVEMTPEGKTQAVPFYNYTVSMTEGGAVPSVDGGSGQNFAPSVTTTNKQALKGKNYYAVFVKTEISNTEDFYNLLANINSGFKAYANYIIKLSGGATEIDLFTSDKGYIAIDETKEFVGNFNGNGYSIVTKLANSEDINNYEGKPLFGIVSEHSYISNLTLIMQAGVEYKTPTELDGVSAIGSFVNINKGVIENVTLTVYASVIGDAYVGGMAGYNTGTISGVEVSILSVNSFGTEYGGTVSGDIAGGVVGLNKGTVGSERLDSIKLTINYGSVVQSAVLGATAAGGIVGQNEGRIENVNSRISGRVSSHDLNEDKTMFAYKLYQYSLADVSVGGVAGINESEIVSAIVYINDRSEFYSYRNGSVGGIVGVNENLATLGTSEEAEGLKVYVLGEVNGKNSSTFGGLAGTNKGSVIGGVVSYRSIRESEGSQAKYITIHGFDIVGGAIGINDSATRTISVLINSRVTLAGTNTVGGIVGENTREATVDYTTISIDGVVGSNTANYTGGLIGNNNSATVTNSFVVLRNNLAVSSNGSAGLVSGSSVEITAETVNVWAVASNSDTLLANGNGNVGFNALKIVGKEYVNAEFNARGEIKFTASYLSGSTITWYNNISNLESFSSSSNEFIASTDLKNELYHICYYDLIINNEEEFYNVYQYVNDNDLFHGVMFKLLNNITVTKTINPIGTPEHPFTGIFEGNYSKITIEKGGIAGSDYSGIFGYVSDEAVIRNVVIEVCDDVIVGSGMSSYAGILAGRLGGTVENVAINAISAPYSLKADAQVGALAGLVSSNTELKDVWTVIYNGAVSAIGVREGATDKDKDDIVNKISVIGKGKLTVTTEYESTAKTFSVTEGFDYYDNWYSNIGDRETIQSLSKPSIYGTIDERPAESVIEYKALGGIRENDGLSKIDFTLSFIDLVITSAEEFYRFAENINTFGDNGAKFTLNLGKDNHNNYITELTIDLAKLAPIGTKEHPFTGIFDGMVDASIDAGNSCYTIRLVGGLTSERNDYTGLFGFVGEGAKIRNIIVRADNATENKDFAGQTIGDKKSIYTGYLAGYLMGSLENVTVVLGDETELYNINDDSIGGLVGVMGTTASFVNTWLVLAENSTYRLVGGYKEDNGNITLCDDALIETLRESSYMPNIIYICGKGLLNISFERVNNSQALTLQNSCFKFVLNAITGGEPVFGFLPQNDDDEKNKVTTLESSYTDPINGINYLAVFLNPVIRTFDDLVNLAKITNAGRHYKGIQFYQESDIVFPINSKYIPIGGQVSIDSSSLGTEYKLIEFIGIYNGNGHKIIIPEGVTLDDAYAGIFGILGEGARIKNLYVEVSGTIGSDTTKYSGALSAYDNGATLENIIVELKKSALINGTLATGRVTVNNALKVDVYGNVLNWDEVKFAKNVWVLAYNNRFNSESNIVEQSFYDATSETGKFVQNGVFNGGINVITVIAAGEIQITFTKNGDEITGVNVATVSGGNKVKEWYWINNGTKQSYSDISLDNISTNLDSSVNSKIIYASFLKSEISTDDDLVALANDTNNGYDFYGLTFTLTNDVVIDKDNYIGIGADIPFNATFDGCGNKITLANGTIIRGKYAGIFGNIGEYGQLKNVILEINGQIGWTKYTAEEVEQGNANTQYAGAVAYIQGTLDSVIIIGNNAKIDCEKSDDGNTYGAIAFGLDTRNLLSNTWIITSADNQTTSIGIVSIVSDSSINLMKVVGMGSLDVSFDIENGKYVIHMSNHYDDGNDYSIKGWYSNYSKDNQLSKALGVTENDTDVLAGDRGSYHPKTTLINRRYEVVIINTVITSVEQLISISNDVNKGGYTYENTNFALGSDITITEGFTSIGTASTHFKGTFSGYYNGRYYTITMAMNTKNADSSLTPASVPLFAYNEGTIEDLSIVLDTDVRLPSTDVGVVASYNYGTISGVIVSFAENKEVLLHGLRVGGIVAVNAQNARVENCIVIINKFATIKGVVAGGLIGENNGILIGSTGGSSSDFQSWANSRNSVLCGLTEYASVNLFGKLEVSSKDETVAYGGGAVGISQDLAYISRITVRLYDGGTIEGTASTYALGGVVGRSSATLINSVVLSKGDIQGTGSGDVGYFAGSIQGTATNSWLVVDVPTNIVAIGNGYDAVNVLKVSGNGVIDAYIDSANNIIFTNITEQKSDGNTTTAQIDGWYESNGITVSDSIGNVDENTFKPIANITGRTINVVFINLMISSVDDLIVMAKTVNNGLFAKSLTFVLTSDLEISDLNPLTDCIGIYTDNGAYGFKHTFDGGNHTITFKLNDNVATLSSLNNQKYMGIFGYTSNSAVVKNLNVVYEGGTLGTYETVAFGGISGINSGSITNCSVTIKAGVVLVAQKVGGIAGENTRLGIIENCLVENTGRIRAETAFMSDNTSPNAYAGGVVGSNAGTLKNINVSLTAEEAISVSANYHDGSAGATYAGGVTGLNSNLVSHVSLYITTANIVSTSGISAYAGGFSGSNMGTIDSSYIKISGKSSITSTSGIEQVSGGIVGANATTISNVLIDVSADTVVKDSAIGRDRQSTSHLTNVWVYNSDTSKNSNISNVNSMTYEVVNGSANVTYNAVDEITTSGTIVFSAILDNDKGVTMYAIAETDFVSVLQFESGYLSYGADTLVFTSKQITTATHLLATIRRVFNDQTELKALSKALSEGVQQITGEYSLASDITVTGNYQAIGDSNHPFTATFNGDNYNVSFQVTEVDGEIVPVSYGDGGFDELQGMFGNNSGLIKNLCVTYWFSLSGVNSAGIAVTNTGKIANSVVYVALDVTLNNYIAKGISLNENCWVISRQSTAGVSLSGSNDSTNAYSSIVVKGKGELHVDRTQSTLTFIPVCQTENTTFVGFAGEDNTNTLKILSDKPFVTSEYISKVSYSAEFISSVIESRSDLLALCSALDLGYGELSKNKTYTLANDVTVKVDEILSLNKFLGTFDGENHILTITGSIKNNGSTGFVFAKNTENKDGSKNALFRNLTLDLREWVDEAVKMYLFQDSYDGRFENTSILFATDDLRISETGATPKVTANNVYVVTTKLPGENDFDRYTTEGIGIIVVKGTKDVIFETVNGKYFATAFEDELSEVFIGWFGGKFENKTYTESFVNHTSSTVELNNKYSIYSTNFMSNDIKSKEDFEILSISINNGFDMNGKVFYISEDIELDIGFVIGAGNVFRGSIHGQGKNITAYNKLFNTFAGNLRDVIISIDNAVALFDTTIDATLTNVVLISSGENVRISNNTSANMENCWILATSTSEQNVNIITGDKDALTLSASIQIDSNNNVDSVILSVTSKNDNKFIVWYNEDGSVFINNNYFYIEASKKLVNYNVKAINEISDLDEMNALAVAVDNDYFYPVYLVNDLVIDDTYTPINNSYATFYGNGHTISVVNTWEKFYLFTELKAVVYDLKLVVNGDQDVEIADASNPSAGLVNCVIELKDNATSKVVGNVNNTWIVKTIDEDSFTATYSLQDFGLANVFTATMGVVITTIDPSAKSITFSFAENDNNVLLGFVTDSESVLSDTYKVTYTEEANQEITGKSVQAYVVNKTINNTTDWNNLALAVNETGNKLSGIEIYIGEDLNLTYVDGGIQYLEKLESIEGTINGKFNSIIVKAVDENGNSQEISSGFQGLISTSGDGKVINLAVELFSEVTEVLNNSNVENCWVISYVGTVSTNAGLIEVKNKAGKNSVITVNEENGNFAFDTNDQDEYRLYHWYNKDGYIDGDVQTNNDSILTLENGKFTLGESEITHVVAEYQECYTIYVDVIDPITNTPIIGVRPNVPENNTYFPVETTHTEITAELSTGYIFWGFDFEDIYGAITYNKAENLKTLRIDDMSKLGGSITLTAYYSLLKADFTSIYYGDMTPDEIDSYLVLDKEQSDKLSALNAELLEIDPKASTYQVNRTIRAEESTLPLVNDLPKHAGSYEITFMINSDSSIIGLGVSTLTVKPRELHFTDLTIDEKIYDTSPYTKIAQKVLTGFTDEDNSDVKISTLDFSKIKLAFVDPITGEKVSNAGNGYYVMITEDSTLSSTLADYHFDVDYMLPQGEILYRYTVNNNGEAIKLEPFTFGIEKANLSINIPSITIDYLEQFRVDKDGKCFDINDLFKQYYKVEGLKDGDDDVLIDAKILLVEGDEIVKVNGELVYIYNIKQSGSYAISPMSGVLDNYNIDTVTSTARLRINPTPVNVGLNTMTLQYGNKITSLDYHFHKDGECVDANNDGICDNAFELTEEQVALLARQFNIKLNYKDFASKYLSINLAIEHVYDNDGNVLTVFVPSENQYGIKYRFLQNANFTYANTDGEFIYNANNAKEYILTQDNVLKIIPRDVTVEYVGAGSKVFASAESDYARSARAVGSNKLVNGDVFHVTREGVGTKEFELVGKYDLHIGVVDSEGNDVTSYYNLTYYNGIGYKYEITVRTVKVSHLGNSYYYGDLASQKNMRYSTNLGASVIASIVSIFGSANEKTLEDIGIKLSVGYFGNEIQNVGTYNCEYNFQAPDNLAGCLEFVPDTKNCTYTIIPAKLTIQTNAYERDYDRTDEITFKSNNAQFIVNGFVGNDANYLVVKNSGYTGDVKANAGMYFYRPTGCKLELKSSNGKDYLLDNYVIDKITDGRYTIKPLQLSVAFEVGYYQEDGTFVSTDNMYFFGDQSAVINFTAIGSLPGTFEDLYYEEVDETFSDKQISEWLVRNFELTYMDLSRISVEKGTVSVTNNVNDLYLRSDNSNISVSGSGFFSISAVNYILNDVTFTTKHGTNELLINAKVSVIDLIDELPIEHYVFNSEIRNLKAGETFNLSDNVRIIFDFANEYKEGDKVTYTVSLSVNTSGTWKDPSFDYEIYMKSIDNPIATYYGDFNELETVPQTSDVEIIYSDWDRLVVIATEKPYIIALIVIAVLLVVAIISIVGVIIYRKKRITKAAWREVMYEDMWNEHKDE